MFTGVFSSYDGVVLIPSPNDEKENILKSYLSRYHWLCVGINSEPSENQDWFCTRCMAKKQVCIHGKDLLVT